MASEKLEQIKHLLKGLIVPQLKPQKYSIGVDIGTTAVKAVALGPRKSGKPPQLLGRQSVSSNGSKEDKLAAAIQETVTRLEVPCRSITLGISGQSVIMRVVEMPTMAPDELKQALPFEAQRYLPFALQDVIIDGQLLGPASAKKSWVVIVACKKELVQQRIAVAKQAGFEVAIIDVDALALTNAFLAQAKSDASDAKDQADAIIDVGGHYSNVVICRGGIPYLVRDIPWGSERFKRELAEQLNCQQAELDQRLENFDSSEETQTVCKAVIEGLIVELQLSFDYFENQFGHPPKAVFVSGGLSQSHAFMQGIQAHLNQPIVSWSPLEALPPDFSVAYGLALRKH